MGDTHTLAQDLSFKNNAPALTASTTNVSETTRDVKSFLNDEKTKKICAESANYIQGKLKNWFTIDQMLDKTTYNSFEVAIDILNLLCLAELCYREVKSGVTKYKICLTPEAKLSILYDELKESEERTAYLIAQIEITTKKVSN